MFVRYITLPILVADVIGTSFQLCSYVNVTSQYTRYIRMQLVKCE